MDTHARSVASIASSPISDASLVQAAQPLYYCESDLTFIERILKDIIAAKHIFTVAEKFKMWTLLGEIENRLGFHTGHRIKQLQQQFKLV